jgi:hypothetical protein
MNERIKELALQAGLRFTQLMSNPMVPVVDGKETDLEKFAELIVKECAEQIKLKGTDWIDWMPSQLGIRPEYVAMAHHIKKHFGVEE